MDWNIEKTMEQLEKDANATDDTPVRLMSQGPDGSIIKGDIIPRSGAKMWIEDCEKEMSNMKFCLSTNNQRRKQKQK